ncbi:MAG TPA: helix-turn-helix domain-containing protein [Blastocatellia bacterium]|nr:helix-turn-helix domain-containing protein [Blastocatellia bacterium]
MESNKEQVLITLSEIELAERLGISRVTAWRLRRDGRLLYFRIGRKVRYSEQHIAEFLSRCERKAERGRNSRQ